MPRRGNPYLTRWSVFSLLITVHQQKLHPHWTPRQAAAPHLPPQAIDTGLMWMWLTAMLWGCQTYQWWGKRAAVLATVTVPLSFESISILSYQLRIECMLICEETTVVLDMIQPKAEAIRRACEGKWPDFICGSYLWQEAWNLPKLPWSSAMILPSTPKKPPLWSIHWFTAEYRIQL